jgi:hypothetical protein
VKRAVEFADRAESLPSSRRFFCAAETVGDGLRGNYDRNVLALTSRRGIPVATLFLMRSEPDANHWFLSECESNAASPQQQRDH